jgi:transcriptional regulator with XRE-family HTH domain
MGITVGHGATDDPGGRLRRARESMRYSISDVARITKITPRLLEAIERNDAAPLPGGIFTRGYLRAYADVVGLDAEVAEQLVRDFPAARDFDREVERRQTIAEEPPVTKAPTQPTAEELPSFPSGWAAMAVLFFAVVLVMYLGFGGRGDSPTDEAERAVAASSGSDTGVALTVATGGIEESPHAPEPARSDRIVLEIEAVGPCWLAVSADGERVAYRLMMPGERETVEARQEIVARFGDAGAVKHWINGVPGLPLGDTGQPVTVSLRPETQRGVVIRD